MQADAYFTPKLRLADSDNEIYEAVIVEESYVPIDGPGPNNVKSLGLNKSEIKKGGGMADL